MYSPHQHRCSAARSAPPTSSKTYPLSFQQLVHSLKNWISRKPFPICALRTLLQKQGGRGSRNGDLFRFYFNLRLPPLLLLRLSTFDIRLALSADRTPVRALVYPEARGATSAPSITSALFPACPELRGAATGASARLSLHAAADDREFDPTWGRQLPGDSCAPSVRFLYVRYSLLSFTSGVTRRFFSANTSSPPRRRRRSSDRPSPSGESSPLSTAARTRPSRTGHSRGESSAPAR